MTDLKLDLGCGCPGLVQGVAYSGLPTHYVITSGAKAGVCFQAYEWSTDSRIPYSKPRGPVTWTKDNTNAAKP